MKNKFRKSWALLFFVLLAVVRAPSVFSEIDDEQTVYRTQWISYASAESDTESSEDMFAGFVFREMEAKSQTRMYNALVSGQKNAGSNLKGTDRGIYEVLTEFIKEVARGNRASTEFEVTLSSLGLDRKFTAEDLGVDAIRRDGSITDEAAEAFRNLVGFNFDRVSAALLADLPFDLYWYDKVQGVSYSYGGYVCQYDTDLKEDVLYMTTDFMFCYSVAEEYSAGTYTVNTAIGQTVIGASDYAHEIVASVAGNTDYEKLTAYRNRICDEVSYNSSAAAGEADYGNPWQLIWVFDRDPSTNVVCEGYSKAFQYLCELTSFDESIYCYSVTGYLSGGTGAGPHMWNIVTMEDGRNYLVDVTNCDSGTVGAPDMLFLAGYVSGEMESWYGFKCNSNYTYYHYDNNAFLSFTEEVLELAPESYVYNPDSHKHEWNSGTVIRTPGCTEPGEIIYTCMTCGDSKTEEIAALGHAYKSEVIAPTAEKEGYTLHTCTRCGDSYKTDIIPAIKASKPKLSAIYNSSNGADIRFKSVEGATAYVIERKENGVWSDVVTVNASDLEKAGSDLKYIDQSIKGKEYYGKGYIYSVAAIVDGKKTEYDTTGLALYRLEQPEISTVSIDKNGKCTAIWKSTNAHGYELQYSSDDGKTWTKVSETDKLTVTVSGLDPKVSYVFRLRSFKDNANRGRTYSQYSAWAKPDEVVTPVMVTIYNSANGADIRWKVDSSKSYVIMRKENGVWKEIRTVEASTLEKEGSNYKYIDTEVKSNYGKGYIYSVAVKDSKGTLHYDTAGIAFYRLNAPKIRSTETDGAGAVLLEWSKESCQGYEIQYSSDNGGTWTKYYMQIDSGSTTSLTVNGLKKNTKYIFRIRCQKTNSDRGTVWSSYSSWKAITTENTDYYRQKWYCYDSNDDVIDTEKWMASAGEFRSYVMPVELTASNWKQFFIMTSYEDVKRDEFGDVVSRKTQYVICLKEPYTVTSETVLKIGCDGNYVTVKTLSGISVQKDDNSWSTHYGQFSIDGFIGDEYSTVYFDSFDSLKCIKCKGYVYHVDVPEDLIYHGEVPDTLPMNPDVYWTGDAYVYVNNYQKDIGGFGWGTVTNLWYIADLIYDGYKTWG